jgi:hypothetical protein
MLAKKRIVPYTNLLSFFILPFLLHSLCIMSFYRFLIVYAEKNNDNNNHDDDNNNEKAKLDCEDAATVLVVAVVGAGVATEEVDEVLDEGDIGNIFDINENEIENVLDKLKDQCEDEESERLIGFAENQRDAIPED